MFVYPTDYGNYKMVNLSKMRSARAPSIHTLMPGAIDGSVHVARTLSVQQLPEYFFYLTVEPRSALM